MNHLDQLAAETAAVEAAADLEHRTHQPAYYEETRHDELYITCTRCGQEWPCEKAGLTDPKDTP